MLDNHMVADTEDAPWNAKDEDRERVDCETCNKQMYLSNEDGETIEDADGEIKAGEIFNGKYYCKADCVPQEEV